MESAWRYCPFIWFWNIVDFRHNPYMLWLKGVDLLAVLPFAVFLGECSVYMNWYSNAWTGPIRSFAVFFVWQMTDAAVSTTFKRILSIRVLSIYLVVHNHATQQSSFNATSIDPLDGIWLFSLHFLLPSSPRFTLPLSHHLAVFICVTLFPRWGNHGKHEKLSSLDLPTTCFTRCLYGRESWLDPTLPSSRTVGCQPASSVVVLVGDVKLFTQTCLGDECDVLVRGGHDKIPKRLICILGVTLTNGSAMVFYWPGPSRRSHGQGLQWELARPTIWYQLGTSCMSHLFPRATRCATWRLLHFPVSLTNQSTATSRQNPDHDGRP